MMSFEEAAALLDDIAMDFPEAFYRDLNGGIQFEEDALPDPPFPPGKMYIMGEYVQDLTGNFIVLYYGSFAALLADEPDEVWEDELFATLAHEFTHHLEHMGGLHALDDKDAEFLRQALAGGEGESGEQRSGDSFHD